MLDAGLPPDLYPENQVWDWAWPKWISPKRRLLKSEAEEVQKYINLIVRNDYPFQLREFMGRHLWVEFCEYYAINPDIKKALRYL